jgi:tetratricopeptide (TPR) repeat protein
MPFNKPLVVISSLACCIFLVACSSPATNLATSPSASVASASVASASVASASAATPPAPATAPAATAAAAMKPERAALSPAMEEAYEDANRALKAGRIQEAERAFKSLVKNSPNLAGPHASLGLIYRNAGQLPEALSEFETAALLNPANAVLQQQLGLTHRHLGQFQLARQAYEKALSLDSNYGAAILNLGILFDLYLGDAQRALEMYTRYLALNPADATVGKWVTELKNRKPLAAAAPKKEAS